TSPVTLLEMVSAYTTIAQNGEHRDPVFVRRITDRYGEVIEQFGDEPYRVLSENTAQQLIDMMRGVVQRGTGTALGSSFGIQADGAGKSGTAQNNTEGWFILMHPHLVAGAWVGFNDQRVTMRSDYWGQGGRNAILLVGDFFQQALQTGKLSKQASFPRATRNKGTLVEARNGHRNAVVPVTVSTGHAGSLAQSNALRNNRPAPSLAPVTTGTSTGASTSTSASTSTNTAASTGTSSERPLRYGSADSLSVSGTASVLRLD